MTPSLHLTPREHALVRAIVVDGRTNREIADELGVSEQTVKNQLSVVFQKFRVRSRLAATGTRVVVTCASLLLIGRLAFAQTCAAVPNPVAWWQGQRHGRRRDGRAQRVVARQRDVCAGHRRTIVQLQRPKGRRHPFKPST
jgi:DNA-binding CsgD family transcriptional regulator